MSIKALLVICLILASNTWGQEVEVYDGRCGSFAQKLVKSKTVLSSAKSEEAIFVGEFLIRIEEDIDFVLNGWTREGDFWIGKEDSMLMYKGISGEWLLDSRTSYSYSRKDEINLRKNSSILIHARLRVLDDNVSEWRIMFRAADKSKCVVSRPFYVEFDRDIELEGFVPWSQK